MGTESSVERREYITCGDCGETVAAGFVSVHVCKPIAPNSARAAQRVLIEGARIHPEGFYGNDNERETEEHVGAALGHVAQWIRGERKDRDSGEDPLAHAIARLMIAFERENPR